MESSLPRTATARAAGGRRVRHSSHSAGIERNKLRITEGENSLMRFGDEQACDMRCKVCGSFLYSVVREGQFVHVAMGTLVDAPTIRPTEHIFVGSKAPWFTITDDLPQYEEHVTTTGPDGA